MHLLEPVGIFADVGNTNYEPLDHRSGVVCKITAIKNIFDIVLQLDGFKPLLYSNHSYFSSNILILVLDFQPFEGGNADRIDIIWY